MKRQKTSHTDPTDQLPDCLNSNYGVCIPSVEKGLARYGPLSDEYNFLYDKKDEMHEMLEDIESSTEIARVINLGFLSIKYTENIVTYKQFFCDVSPTLPLSTVARSTIKSKIGISNIYKNLHEDQKYIVDSYMKIWIKKIIQDYIIHTRSRETSGEILVSLNLTQRKDSAIGFHKDFYPFCNYFTLTYLNEGETLGPSIRSDMLPDGNFTTSSIIVGKLTTLGWTNGIEGDSYHSTPIRGSSIKFSGPSNIIMHSSSKEFVKMSNELLPTIPSSMLHAENLPRLVPNDYLSTIDERFIPRVDDLLHSGLGWRNFLRVLYLDKDDITPYIIEEYPDINFDYDIYELIEGQEKITYIEVDSDPLVHPETSGLFLGGEQSKKNDSENLLNNKIFEKITTNEKFKKIDRSEVFEKITTNKNFKKIDRSEVFEILTKTNENISILDNIFGGKSKSKKSKSKRSKRSKSKRSKRSKSKRSKGCKGCKSKKLMRFF